MIRHPELPNGNIYLSGGIDYAKNRGADWRHDLSNELLRLRFLPLDPVRMGNSYNEVFGNPIYGKGNIDTSTAALLHFRAQVRRQLIYADLHLIQNHTDALVVFYDDSVRRGAGTISECQFAYTHDIPVFLVSDWENWRDEVPGWLIGLTTKITTSFDDMVEYLGLLPPEILKRDMYGNRHSKDGQNHYLCSLSGEPFRKTGSHFASTVSPLYNKQSVSVVHSECVEQKDRYDFFLRFLESITKEPVIADDSVVAVDKRELARLRADQAKLQALEQAGVDNWEWFDDAMDTLREQDFKP